MKTVLTQWRAWYEAFETSVMDDDWSRLAPFLTEDVQYRVTGLPFACVVRGRDAVLAGFRKSFDGFDRKFDQRSHQVVGTRVFEPGLVRTRIWSGYEKAGLPKLEFAAIGEWHFEGDRIGLMVDVYDSAEPELGAALNWLDAHGAALGGLDPSYI
jgi:hypothetical protein